MTKWEYRWDKSCHLSARQMNVIGEEGWEFAGSVGDFSVFKRPKQEPVITAEAPACGCGKCECTT